MRQQEAYEKELSMWRELFTETTLATQRAAEGLIQKAAYLHALCAELEKIISESGAVKVHPQHPDLQRQVPAVKEYARLTEAYANIVNKLNALRTRNTQDEDHELDEYE